MEKHANFKHERTKCFHVNFPFSAPLHHNGKESIMEVPL